MILLDGGGVNSSGNEISAGHYINLASYELVKLVAPVFVMVSSIEVNARNIILIEKHLNKVRGRRFVAEDYDFAFLG